MTVLHRDVSPREVYCITADVHADLSIADEVAAGRFTHAGETRELGVPPDWQSTDLPADEEWRIEWHKFYYGLDLAHAFAIKGDAVYLRTWEELVRSFIRQAVPLGSADVAARRMQNWTYAWQRFAAAPGFDGLADGLGLEIVESVRDHVDVVRRNLTPEPFRNHRVLELYALFVVALAFPDLDDGLGEFAIGGLHGTLSEGFHADGVHREQSPHYHSIALRSLTGARENARRFGLAVPAGFDARLERACEFAMHCHRPDGLVPALSDADSGSYPEVLGLAAELFGRADFTYVASVGEHGVPPKECATAFPNGGYFFQRSGWRDEGERYLVFDCGPVGDGGHGHYDALSVEVYAGGRPLLVDPGRFTYADGPDRRWFKGTAAHNTVTVDDLDQTPYRRGRPGPDVAEAVFLGRRTGRGLDVLAGRVHSPCYDAVHTRRISFLDDAYWIVEDEIAAASRHRYDLRWHLPPDALDATTVGTTNDGHPVVHAPGVTLRFPPPVPESVGLEPGWVSPSYGVRSPAPVVRATRQGCSVRFVTVVTPVEEGSSR